MRRPIPLLRLSALSLVLLSAACERSELPTGVPTGVPGGPLFAKPATPGGGGGGGDDGGSTSPSAHNPILFVHGYNSDGSTWNTMVGRFKKDGWADSELHAWTYNSKQSNKTTAQELKTKVEEILSATGAAKVDVITHSMGGLSSRYYVKYLQGEASIDAWVSLAGPNHGTKTANACGDPSCEEMRIGSAFLTNITDGLNHGDETPGMVVRYGTWWSPCDEVIDPRESVIVDGATNTKTACMPHRQLKEDSKVYRAVRDFVATK